MVKFTSREAVNYALDGTVRNVLLQFTVFPGYEHDWVWFNCTLTDITARKKQKTTSNTQVNTVVNSFKL